MLITPRRTGEGRDKKTNCLITYKKLFVPCVMSQNLFQQFGTECIEELKHYLPNDDHNIAFNSLSSGDNTITVSNSISIVTNGFNDTAHFFKTYLSCFVVIILIALMSDKIET